MIAAGMIDNLDNNKKVPFTSYFDDGEIVSKDSQRGHHQRNRGANQIGIGDKPTRMPFSCHLNLI